MFLTDHLFYKTDLCNNAYADEGNLPPEAGEGARIKEARKYLKTLTAQDPLNEDEVLSAMNKLFWYPKIPAEKLIDLTKEGAKQEWAEIVEKRKYRKGTLPRDNSEEKLIDALVTHIHLVFCCYPVLEKLDSSGKIPRRFKIQVSLLITLRRAIDTIQCTKIVQELEKEI